MEKRNKIRVLQVFGSLNCGGAECRMMDIYRHIDRSVYQFDFVSLLQEQQFFEEEIQSLGGHVLKLHSPRECGILRHISELRECIREGDYQAVHAHTSYHCGLAMLAAKLEGVPVRISHARTTGSKRKGILKSIFFHIGRTLINRCSTVRFAISKNAGNFLFGKHQFEVVPNAIDMETYQNITADEIKQLKREIKITEDQFVIGQIGRFDSMKNHRFTVQWFAQFSALHPEAVLVLIGDGKLRNEIETLARDLRVDDKIIFTGVRNDVPHLIHVLNVLIFPSLFEGLGGVALEAQAAGIPCVESDAIPEEADLHLGLVKQVSLQAPMEEWNSRIEESRKIQIPDNLEIKNAFAAAGYSIEAVTDRYLNAYRGS